MISVAVLSPGGVYRYALTRDWSAETTRRTPKPRVALFVMLNPSTADDTNDDPTIRRCISFARREDCTALAVVNLYAHRTSKPAELRRAESTGADVVGPANDSAIRELASSAHRVICAWGNMRPGDRGRVWETLALLTPIVGNDGLWCLGKTRNGSPRHPLYVKGDQPFQPFEWWSPPRTPLENRTDE